MKRPRLKIPVLTLLSVMVLGALWSPAASISEEKESSQLSPVNQQQLQHGWWVCLVGEVGSVSGVGRRQMFELCHADGWRISTYCIKPGRPAPEQGSYCSQTSQGVFWCGDKVQELQQLAVLQTPAPQNTPVPTLTAVPTNAPAIGVTLIPIQSPNTLTPSPQQDRGPGMLVVGLMVLWAIMLAAAASWIYRHWNTTRHT